MLSINDIINVAGIVAKEFEIKKITLFGSYADGTNTPESDVDLLVEFYSEAVSLLTLAGVKNRIEELLNIQVDVVHGPLDDDSFIEPKKVVEIYAA